MKFVRILWGDFNRYQNQIIEAKSDNLNEVVYVWGKDNYNNLKNLGYDCVLISDDPYDYTIADNHTFVNHKSLIHKIIGLGHALHQHDEIIFVDWDCRKIKEIDDNFYNLIRNRNSDFQVPLYTYPMFAFDRMIGDVKDDIMINFFKKLQTYITNFSFKYGNSFIIPNTGFIYCSNKDIIVELIKLIIQYDLQTVPDELSIFLYTKNLGLDGYIEKIEPLVIDGKEHGHDWWNNMEAVFTEYKNRKIEKEIYFKHL